MAGFYKYFHKPGLVLVARGSVLMVPVLALGLMTGLAAFSPGPVSAEACPPSNDIMTDGFSSSSNFISQVQNGDSSGHSDLKAIYSDFGLDEDDYAKFSSSAVDAVAQKDGDILVDGVVVGTDGRSFGRTESCQGSGPESMSSGGTTIWGNVHAKTFVNDNLKMKVLMDETGTMKFAVLDTCGNPSKFKPVKPVFSCDLLEKHEVEGKENTFTFTTKATATNNATIAKVVYNFGDGSPEVTLPDGNTPTPAHTFTQSATVKVTVFVDVPGKKGIPVTSEKCETPIVVKEKPVPPAPKPKPQPVPEVLPKIGAGVGAMVGLFGAVSVGGYAAHHYWLMRRKPVRATRTRE